MAQIIDTKKIEDYNWHDAILKHIEIDRNQPGVKDEIILNIELLDKQNLILIFENVYLINLILNGGIIAKESILNIHNISEGDEDLSNLLLKWRGLLDFQLNSYLIELNSTGSTLKVISREYKILKI